MHSLQGGAEESKIFIQEIDDFCFKVRVRFGIVSKSLKMRVAELKNIIFKFFFHFISIFTIGMILWAVQKQLAKLY